MRDVYYSVSHLGSDGVRVDQDYKSIEEAAKAFAHAEPHQVPSVLKLTPGGVLGFSESASTIANTSVLGGDYMPEKRLLVGNDSPFYSSYYNAVAEKFSEKGVFSKKEIDYLSQTINKHPVGTFVGRRAMEVAHSDAIKNQSTYVAVLENLKEVFGFDKGIVATFAKEYGKHAEALGLSFTAVEVYERVSKNLSNGYKQDANSRDYSIDSNQNNTLKM